MTWLVSKEYWKPKINWKQEIERGKQQTKSGFSLGGTFADLGGL